MRIIDSILLILLLSLSSVQLERTFVKEMKKEAVVRELKNKTESLNFISESFRATCRGTGFSSLEEWADNCKKMFLLESINWTNEERKNDGKVLVFANWDGPYGEGKAVEVLKKGAGDESKNK